MKRKYCRYSDSMLISLGLRPENTPSDDYEVSVNCPYSSVDMIEVARGKFGQILDVLYTSKDGDLDNSVKTLVSESAPIEIQSFVKNVLMCPLKPLKAAPDDASAFDMIIPRSAQTSRELIPYLDVIKNEVSAARQRYLESHQPQSKSE